ncbi:MAG: class I SAM-dependent methyltransferase [Polaromonas sp.]|uniref:TylF/MycF/NovP-related O-methyltransferase n=1 Tax=Polaromonas sp. TaxID=1869339 RepID=UPI0025D03502|nr:TylF/MycF/NovP-related O-methyltransferase [Polaromonas sp.]MBI2725891.1 class I SAM-dependent methyltransferase [Polaromonas sp.]
MSQSNTNVAVDPQLLSSFEELKSLRRHGRDAKDYLARRKAFAEEIGSPDLWHFVDHFGLYAGTQTIATYMAVHDLVRDTMDVPGHVMEFGSHHGAKLMFMAKLLQLYSSNSIKKVFGFDSFEGLRTFGALDGEKSRAMEGHYTGNEDVLRKSIQLFGYEEWVHLVKGDARVTIPAFADAFPHVMVSLAYVDFDLYEPCQAALKFLGPRMATGGIIAFDEALTDFFPGEGIALLEFLEDQAHARFEMKVSPIALQPTIWLVKK